jgi:hypothetical protein
MPLLLSLGDVGEKKSIDPKGVRDELRTEFILLNGASKDINKIYQA